MKHLFIALFILAFVIAGCNSEKSKNTETGKTNETSVNEDKKNNDIIRNENVKVADIDQNKDGKVFQCPMDFDVISDKQEPCPKCNMDLDELSIVKSEENLKGSK